MELSSDKGSDVSDSRYFWSSSFSHSEPLYNRKSNNSNKSFELDQIWMCTLGFWRRIYVELHDKWYYQKINFWDLVCWLNYSWPRKRDKWNTKELMIGYIYFNLIIGLLYIVLLKNREILKEHQIAQNFLVSGFLLDKVRKICWQRV